MGEEWLPVVGYEQFYKVNSSGTIVSLRTGKIRKPVRNPQTGYNTMILSGNHVKKTICIHRIVAEAFIENPNGYGCVNHKDENKLNNAVENLEWCSKAYNNTYNGKTQRCCKKIIQRDPNTGIETIWDSARKASRAGIADYKNISACCRGLRKKTGGYEWRFAK